ncbi:MAG: hypothetical protein ACOYEW_07975 [Anaerolineae bacterium]
MAVAEGEQIAATVEPFAKAPQLHLVAQIGDRVVHGGADGRVGIESEGDGLSGHLLTQRGKPCGRLPVT